MSNCIFRTIVTVVASLVALGAADVAAETTVNSTASTYFGNLSESDLGGYTDWLADHGSVDYTRHIFLPTVTDPNNGAAVFWTFFNNGTDLAVAREAVADATTATHIQFAVAVRATGWVALGLSEVGGMRGADIAIFEVANPTGIIDAYVLEERVPIVDDCASDYKIVRHTDGSDGWLIVEFSRPLDTKDPQDRTIIDDRSLHAPSRLISAWGDTDAYGYHGFNVARNAAKLFGEQEDEDYALQFEQLMAVQSDGHFDVRETNYSIPETETTYNYRCKTYAELKAEFNLPDTENGTLTFIGAKPALSPETEQYVHHFIGTKPFYSCPFLLSSCHDSSPTPRGLSLSCSISHTFHRRPFPLFILSFFPNWQSTEAPVQKIVLTGIACYGDGLQVRFESQTLELWFGPPTGVCCIITHPPERQLPPLIWPYLSNVVLVLPQYR